MVQKFLPEIVKGDKRVLVMGKTLGPILQSRGLLLAGVDVIGDCVSMRSKSR